MDEETLKIHDMDLQYQNFMEEPVVQQDNIISQKNQDSNQMQQKQPQQIPIIPDMAFVPPPVTDSSKYLGQLENQFLQSIAKNPSSLDYLFLFGEKRPIDITKKQLPEPLFVDNQVKQKLKKMTRSIYEKMIQSLKYCAGQMPQSYSSPLPRITEKTHEFMLMCEQLQVAQTKSVIWKIMQEETNRMNEKSQQIEKFIEEMVQHCKKQSLRYF